MGSRVLIAILIIVAVAVQFCRSVILTGNSPVNFFSYFTIQSNLLAAAVLLWGAFKPVSQGQQPNWSLIRGAAVLYLSITGVVYELLLSWLIVMFGNLSFGRSIFS